MSLRIFILLTLVSLGFGTKIRFDNYKLVSLSAQTPRQLDIIQKFQVNPDFDVWNHVRGLNEEIDVLLSPSSFVKYKAIFDSFGIDFRIKNEDIQKLIDFEQGLNLPFKKFSSNASKFMTYNEILDLMAQLSYENSFLVSNYSAGKTHMNKDLIVLRLKTPTSKRSLWLDCGIHAREWITISTCVYIIQKLVNDYKENDLDVVRLLNHYEIHIMPVVNPDGYEYTMNTDRMWRKNRNPNDNVGCYGVDLNRNFGFYWLTAGSSSYQCSPIYAGHMADSEPETKAIQNAILFKQGQWDSYISLHSYGQFFFTPWGFTSILPSDYADLAEKAKIATKAIKSVNGSEYSIGSSSNLLYISSGGSEDWAKARAGIKYSYSIELGPKDLGTNGFIVPETDIPIAGEEIYQGLKALYTELLKENIFLN